MEYSSQDIKNQIDNLKRLISIDAPKEVIKAEQLKLNDMLKMYLDSEK